MAASEEYHNLLEDMWELHQRKNKGYNGDNVDPWSNFRMCEEFGISAEDGIITRMSDKWARLQSLYKSNGANDQVGESLIDTLQDLAAYSLILVCVLSESPGPNQALRDAAELYMKERN